MSSLPAMHAAGWKRTRAREHLMRFVFGGAISAVCAWITQRHGPLIGGLFLAFPAILPASLTLVQQHQGRREAVDEARGACMGSAGLLAFALSVWAGARLGSAFSVLAAALVAWFATCLGVWLLLFGSRSSAARG